jgi:hypothetical protein
VLQLHLCQGLLLLLLAQVFACNSTANGNQEQQERQTQQQRQCQSQTLQQTLQ